MFLSHIARLYCVLGVITCVVVDTSIFKAFAATSLARAKCVSALFASDHSYHWVRKPWMHCNSIVTSLNIGSGNPISVRRSQGSLESFTPVRWPEFWNAQPWTEDDRNRSQWLCTCLCLNLKKKKTRRRFRKWSRIVKKKKCSGAFA